MSIWRASCITFLLVFIALCDGYNFAHERNIINRRSLLVAISGSSAITLLSSSPVQAKGESIISRFHSDILQQPSTTSTSELNGIDNTYFPDFLEGTWDATQTLVDVKAPLGLKFMGGPNGLESIAEQTLADSKSRLNQPVKLQLRYVRTKWGVAEDRVFNTPARLNSFASRNVVASANYADVGGSNRATVLAMGGTEEDPLQTVIVRFKGPAAQKTFVTAHGSEWLNEAHTHWAGYECQRSIFALTNQNPAPPIFTDTELLFDFEKIDDKHVKGRLRIAGYLNAQSDKLYFDARKRAVSLQDYSIDLAKIS